MSTEPAVAKIGPVTDLTVANTNEIGQSVA